MAKETQSEDAAKRFEAHRLRRRRPSTATTWTAFLAAFERAKKAGSGKPQLIIAKTLIGKGIPEVAGHAEGARRRRREVRRRRAQGPRAAGGALTSSRPRCARSSPSTRRSSTPRTPRGRRRSRPGRPRTRSSPRSSATSRAYAHTLPAGHGAAHAGRRRAARRDPGVPGRHQDRDAQGGPGRAAAARGAGPAAHRRQRRSLRLDAELHRRSQGRRRRLQAGPPHRAQHPLRHPRARHVLDPERHRRARHLPPERRDVPGLRRLLPRRRSASRRSATCRSSTSSRTTASASARTARRTSRSRPIPGLRVIPNLDVIRPADPEETAGAFVAALERTDGPTLLALTRQAVPLLERDPGEDAPRRRRSRAATSPRRRRRRSDLILLSAGSELQHALAAAEQLGAGHARRQHARASRASIASRPTYREEVLPEVLPPPRRRSRRRSPRPGRRYVGLDGVAIGIDRFGLSAPGAEVMKELGITAEHVVSAAKQLIAG